MMMHILVGAVLITNVVSTVDDTNPVSKVVNLLKEMKTQVEKEATEDKEIYDEMACWCKTNNKEKTQAVEIAQKTIGDLTAQIETYEARKATLANEIESLGDENAANTDALAQATAMREKEAAEFQEEEATSKQASAALKQAIEVLSKVQLSQLPPKPEVLLQLDGITKVLKKTTQLFKFKDVMQEDLWNLLSELGGGSRGSFLPGTRTITGLEQQEPEAIEGGGAAAGAKSYNSRSGQILGMLSTMKHEFDTDLAASQKEELGAQIAFQSLRAAKESRLQPPMLPSRRRVQSLQTLARNLHKPSRIWKTLRMRSAPTRSSSSIWRRGAKLRMKSTRNVQKRVKRRSLQSGRPLRC
jgi:hypothetical protein